MWTLCLFEIVGVERQNIGGGKEVNKTGRGKGKRKNEGGRRRGRN